MLKIYFGISLKQIQSAQHWVVGVRTFLGETWLGLLLCQGVPTVLLTIVSLHPTQNMENIRQDIHLFCPLRPCPGYPTETVIT